MRRVSIRWLLMIVMFTVSMSGMLLFHTVYGSMTNATFSQLDFQIIINGVEQTRDTLNFLLENMDNRFRYILDSVLMGENSSRDVFNARVGWMLAAEPDIDAVLLLGADGGLLAGQIRGQPRENYRAGDEPWFAQVTGAEDVVLTNAHILRARKDDYVWVTSMAQPVRFWWDGKETEGVLVLDIALRALKDICASTVLGDGGYLCVVNSAGEDVYTPKQRTAGLRALSAAYRTVGLPDDRSRRIEISLPCRNDNWFVTGVVLESAMSRSAAALSSRSLLVLLASMALSILLANICSKLIVGPIVYMEHTMKQPVDSARYARLKPTGTKEFVSLSSHYNTMLDKIDQLIAESNKKQELLREMELSTLQDQVNPHFLYNALDSIVWMLAPGGNEEAIKAIEALARLLRLSINKGGNFHSAGREVEHVTAYLHIQSAKLDDRIRFEIIMEQEVQELFCPKIILQPLVENAIKYGVNSSSICKVIVRVWVEADFLKMSVFNDGIGIDPASLKTLNRQMREGEAPEKSRESGIGMRNVNRRVKLLCGDEYGISIESETEDWTCVTCLLPIMRGL